ncbi:MAG: NAD-dependent epimerase/dehydratase family protein [candidate division WOR-3 bacterium]
MGYWQHKRVLVTGGGGFIGLHLVTRLLEEGARVRVAENFERGTAVGLARLGHRIELVEGDLCEQAVCWRTCRDIEVVFHLAAKVGSSEFYRRFPADVVLHNLLLDAQLLQAVRRCHVGRYLYVSSAFVYPIERQQDPDGAPIKEDEAHPASPANSYGWAKLMAEKALEYAVDQDGELSGAIVRFSNIYGPHQSLELERGSIIPVLIRRAIEYPRLKPFFIHGSGQETRTYCYVSDAVEAMLRAVEKLDQYRLVGPLNIGGEEPIRVIELARKIIALSGKDIELVMKPAPPPPNSKPDLGLFQGASDIGVAT